MPESGEYVLDFVPVEVDGYTFDGWYADVLYTTPVTSVNYAKNVNVFGRRKGEKNNASEGIISCGKGEGVAIDLPDGTTATVYPISEKFYMIIQGEAKWLKEMFDVQLLVINNSNTDIMENVVSAFMSFQI